MRNRDQRRRVVASNEKMKKKREILTNTNVES